MDNVEILRGAANLLEEKGHCKYALHDDLGRHCVLGAINMVALGRPQAIGVHGDWNRVRPVKELVMAYLSDGSIFHIGLAEWNNRLDRTGEEVIDVLRTVANLHDTEAVEEPAPQLEVCV